MSKKNLYLSRISSIKYIFVNGKEANFILGQYITDAPEEIQQLDAEVKQGHPHIYTDPNKKEVDATYLDPVEAIKRKAIADYLAQQRALDPSKDAGTSDQTFKIRGTSANPPGATATTKSALQNPVLTPQKILPVQPQAVGNPANQGLVDAPRLNVAEVQNGETIPPSAGSKQP